MGSLRIYKTKDDLVKRLFDKKSKLIMKAKEKAKELVDSFIQRTRNKWELSMSYKRAKDCALIAVDEIINNVELYSTYWQEVKQEIQLL
jgi:hypothetical protein